MSGAYAKACQRLHLSAPVLEEPPAPSMDARLADLERRLGLPPREAPKTAQEGPDDLADVVGVENSIAAQFEAKAGILEGVKP